MTDPPDSERALRKSVTVNATVQVIWWAWTTDAGIRTWLLGDSRIELRVGGPYEWFFSDDAPEGSRGSEGCVILAFQAPAMLTFTWNAPPHLDQVRKQRTVVLLRLRPIGDGRGTRVDLTHLGWGQGGQWDEAFDYFDAAWDSVLNELATHFAAAGD